MPQFVKFIHTFQTECFTKLRKLTNFDAMQIHSLKRILNSYNYLDGVDAISSKSPKFPKAIGYLAKCPKSNKSHNNSC